MSDIVLVTGAAGFVGSHVVERLLARRAGASAAWTPSWTTTRARSRKRTSGRRAATRRFELVEADLATADLAPILDGVTSVCHLAAQAGVRASWGTTFSTYIDCNILSSQRLLEAVKDGAITKFVYASSSSVYGETTDLPMRENGLTCPVSPYGVTKLAAEHLAVLYHRNYGVPTVSLRYFTVYGPRQRPDMAFHRFIRAGLLGEPVTIYGDGRQTRDFTFIDDTVSATVAALEAGQRRERPERGRREPRHAQRRPRRHRGLRGSAISTDDTSSGQGETSPTPSPTTRGRGRHWASIRASDSRTGSCARRSGSSRPCSRLARARTGRPADTWTSLS